MRIAAGSHHELGVIPAVAVAVIKFEDNVANHAGVNEVGHIVGMFSHHEGVGGALRNNGAVSLVQFRKM